MENREIISWIRKALNADEFIDFKVLLEGKNSATEGYTSDMVFAKITQVENDKKYKNFDVAVKFSKKALRQIPNFKAAYTKEMCFYEKVLRIFDEFQEERNIKEKFDAVPKCYSVLKEGDMDVIVLENLSRTGYKLHPRNLTMPIQYFKLVYKNLAKFHALSFAMKEKNEELFKDVAKNFPITTAFLNEMGQFFEKKSLFVIENLREAHRQDLAEKFEKLVAPGVTNLIVGILNDNVDKTAINHFDCHCNNFMFQYEDNDIENPTKVAILDWQIAKVHSPAIDLSYFFYSVGSETEFSEHISLLKYYYEEFSQFLTQLGCDAKTLYTFSNLLDHWKKYSFYGFIYACSFMDFNYFDNDKAPTLDNLDNKNNIGDLFTGITINDPQACRKRLVEVVEHYFENELNKL